jgi:hypothetical protein
MVVVSNSAFAPRFRLVGGDAVRRLVVHLQDAEVVQPAFTLRDHEMVLEEGEPFDLDRDVVRDEDVPVLTLKFFAPLLVVM